MTQGLFDDDDDVAPLSNGYVLGEGDQALLMLTGRLLEQAMLASSTEWAAKTTLAKLMHVMCRLPNRSAEFNVQITFSSPRERYGEEEINFSFTVGVEGRRLKVQYGGRYYHPRTGSDSFSVFAWSAEPDVEPDWVHYGDSLGVVAALVDPVEVLHAMPNILDRCEIHVSDDENPLIGDEPLVHPPLFGAGPAAGSEADVVSEEPADEEDLAARLQIDPVTEADRRLLLMVGPDRLRSTSAGSALCVESCDGCGVDLSSVGLFVDGASPSAGWGNFCARCCLTHGVQVGWGNGQLYARQPSGSWLGVAGFKP